MAFNWQTFRTRALTALVFVAVMLTGLLWNYWSFLILFSVIHFGCWWEYFQIVEKIKKIEDEFNLNLKLGLMVLGYGIMLLIPDVINQVVYDAKHSFYIAIAGYAINPKYILILAGTILTFVGVMQEKPKTLKCFGLAALGLLYISVSWGFMMSLRSDRDLYYYDTMFVFGGSFLPITIIVSIWINDTMAYIVGSVIGKTPLSKISPKKTWEGTIGGIILCAAFTGIIMSLLYVYSVDKSLVLLITPITLIAAITGTFGDLLESKLKRLAGVKDSGSLMPGHGGFLDRFDSLLLATPFVWLYVILFL
jgi:phosphatidate cytidylyltransferase